MRQKQASIATLLAACSVAAIITLSKQAHAQTPTFQMVVHADPTNPAKGWVTDRSGRALYGNAPPGPTAFELLTWAIEHSGAGPGLQGAPDGTRILLTRGDYVGMVFWTGGSGDHNINTMSSSAAAPVIIDGEPGATILGCSSGGCDTIQVIGGAGHPFHHIQWRNIRFEGSGRAALILGSCQDAHAGVSFDGWKFVDCEIDGMYDHKTGLGLASKWGVLTWAVKDFVWQGGSVHGIRSEHAFYLHNNSGDVTVTGAALYEVGRTAVQIVARELEVGCPGPLPPNRGDIRITGNAIADTGLEPADYHAGPSISITGRQDGTTLIKENIIGFGLDAFTPGLRAAILAKADYPSGIPYGSGAIWLYTEQGTGFLPSNVVEVRQNTIVYEQTSGDRPAVVMSAINQATCAGNTIQMGAKASAIELGNCNNPRDPDKPVPLRYSVFGNILLPGRGGGAHLCIAGICSPCSQPQTVTFD